MKLFIAFTAAAAIGTVVAVPIESELLANAKRLYARNSPVSNILKRDLAERAVSDADILNFALNLEYLEAQFYSYATTGKGLDGSLLTGQGQQGGVSGGSKVPFQSQVIQQYANEIATDEAKHVAFLRSALGKAAVAQPALDIGDAFTAAARAAGIISNSQTFSPYTSDTNFLIGAFLFEDTGVTAYQGGVPLISDKDYLAAASGIEAVEAYHASEIRATLFAAGQQDSSIITNVNKAAALIAAAGSGRSQGITSKGVANIVPTTSNSIAFTRTPGQVINIVYLSPDKGLTKGGFFPNGLNGAFKTSAGSSS